MKLYSNYYYIGSIHHVVSVLSGACRCLCRRTAAASSACWISLRAGQQHGRAARRYPHAEILGVDHSPDMIRGGSQGLPGHRFPAVRRVDASVKFVTFIDAMLSLVVTQDVLPEAEGAQHAAQSSGLFGIGLGALTMVIGLWMLLRRRWAAVDSVLDSEQ